jgi:hypothetical protein
MQVHASFPAKALQLYPARFHSALMPATLMIGHHFSASVLCNEASASGFQLAQRNLLPQICGRSV